MGAAMSSWTRAAMHAAYEGYEEDMLPARVCGNCLGTTRVRYDARSGRRLCIVCEPHPTRDSDPPEPRRAPR
jgi:hypothetical protein